MNTRLEQAARTALEVMELDIAASCRWCLGEGGWTSPYPNGQSEMIPVQHKPDCLWVELKDALAEQAGTPSAAQGGKA